MHSTQIHFDTQGIKSEVFTNEAFRVWIFFVVQNKQSQKVNNESSY